jgi:photosystem II stability/assembly factor-like uncharacterized protein
MKQLISIFCLLFFATLSFAQKKTKPVSYTFDHSDSVYFSTTHYRLVGPFRGGRSGAVCGSYKKKNEFFFGATGGGVWKTSDGGSNWKNISDKYFGGSIGSVAVAQSDESVIYVGEGENTLRSNVSEGLQGMWRSGDGGHTWKNIGLKESRHIVRIVIDPKNPDIVWAAVMGHLFGPNEERGIYKTTDGGKNWKRVLYVNNLTGCSDLVMDAGNPLVLYAGMWHVIRTPYSMESGGEGSGMYKSTDGGETWVNISANKGLPKGIWGIVSVAVAPSNTDKVFALIENEKGGLFISKDAGDTWALASQDNEIRQRSWYFNSLFVDPKNEDIVYCPNVGMMKSNDGGKTFHGMNSPHSDHHDLWIDPEDGSRMILADDGGAQISFDGGTNWSSYHNQPTAQFYRVSTDNAFPYHILGAQQDNSTVRIKSRTYGGGITQGDWSSTAGFESGYVVADPLNPEVVYGGNYGGYLSRLDHKTGENRSINVWPDVPIGVGADAQKYRFQWNFPIFFSPNNPKRIYAAGNHLFASENEGQSWEKISPDLTTNDKTRQLPSGGPINKDNTTAEYYCTIFTAAESGIEKDLLWTGSDDGLIYISKDGGKNWDNVTPPDAGKWMMWNSVETDPFKKGTAYFAGTRYKLDDYTPYLYMTENYGKTWKLITNGIDKMHFTRVVRADHKRPGLLYAGTEYGMYISYNYGAEWKKFQLNLPVVPITDLTLKNNDLVVATQGRSFWVLDDLTMVQNYKDEYLKKNLFVFPVNDAYRMNGYVDSNIHNGGMNPPNGVVINFYLKDVNDSSKVSVTIFDQQRKAIKIFAKDAKDKKDQLTFLNGMNRQVWDMEYEPGEKIEGMVLWNGNAGGPKAAPGRYSARVRYGNDSVDVGFVVRGDPNYKVTDEEYQQQVDFLLKVRDKFNDIQKGVKNIRSIRNQINDLMGKVDTIAAKDLKPAADSINKRMTTIEEALYQTKAKAGEDILNFPMRLNDRMAALYHVAASGNNPPTQQVKDAFSELSTETDVQLDKLKKIMSEDLKGFNQMIIDKKIQVIKVKE